MNVSIICSIIIIILIILFSFILIYNKTKSELNGGFKTRQQKLFNDIIITHQNNITTRIYCK